MAKIEPLKSVLDLSWPDVSRQQRCPLRRKWVEPGPKMTVPLAFVQQNAFRLFCVHWTVIQLVRFQEDLDKRRPLCLPRFAFFRFLVLKEFLGGSHTALSDLIE